MTSRPIEPLAFGIVNGCRLFDDIVRTDPEPSRGEDSFSFLNRVATPYWARVRAFLESAFNRYPQAHAADLRSRFRDRRWPVHVGAWWELYLFTLFQALGAQVEVHPTIEGVDSRPDFRVHSQDATTLVEARFVGAGLVAIGFRRNLLSRTSTQALRRGRRSKLVPNWYPTGRTVAHPRTRKPR